MIIGASPTPTRYKVRTQQREHYVRCGADLLLNGMNGDLEAEGRCPVCESIVRFQVKEKRVYQLRPSTSILHILEFLMDNGRVSIECEASPLFDSEECLRAWLNDYKGRPGSIFKPQEFIDHMSRVRELGRRNRNLPEAPKTEDSTNQRTSVDGYEEAGRIKGSIVMKRKAR